MSPKDDPEARIRDLERQLGQVGDTPQFGAATPQYGPSSPPPGTPSFGMPPPPGSPSFGMPPPGPQNFGSMPMPGAQNFGGMPQGWSTYNMPYAMGRSYARRGWLVSIVFFAFVFLPLIGGGLTWALHQASSSRSPGSSGSIVVIPNVGSHAPSSAAPSTLSAAPGNRININGYDLKQTVACNANTVLVGGNSNQITITGHCANVAVSGDDNIVTVDSTDKVTASGTNNEVTYHSGSPDVQTFNNSNVVHQG